jgi:hypothetical protein
MILASQGDYISGLSTLAGTKLILGDEHEGE